MLWKTPLKVIAALTECGECTPKNVERANL